MPPVRFMNSQGVTGSIQAALASGSASPSASGSPMPTPSKLGIHPPNLNGDDRYTSNMQWHFTTRRDHSALFAGILLAREMADCVYIGSVDKYYVEDGTAQDAYALSSDMKKDLKDKLMEQKQCIPLFNDPQTSSEHYEGFCKQGLWPLFHYILWEPTDGRNEKKYWESYVKTNQLFADMIVKTYQNGDMIWIHDYHLFLVPAMVRKALPDATIGFFLHTPFPSSEIFRCLPQRKQLLTAVLGANLIGFQTYAYARHFISTCTRVLGVESTPKGVEYRGFHVAIAIFPIGIDVDQVKRYR
jgi:trehalose 6-phosphate synthase/phosphatase